MKAQILEAVIHIAFAKLPKLRLRTEYKILAEKICDEIINLQEFRNSRFARPGTRYPGKQAIPGVGRSRLSIETPLMAKPSCDAT